MAKAIGLFLVKLLTNRSSDLFVARLGTKVMLLKYGITGIAADIIGFVIRKVVGLLIDSGIYAIDTTWDTITAGMKIDEFRKLALPEYQKAKRKGLTDAEKKQIRKEYLDTLDQFTDLGLSDDAGS